MDTGLNDPLGAVRVISRLQDQLKEKGFDILVKTDLAEFNALKLKLRGERAHPYHDPEICGLPPEREFWLSLNDQTGRVVGLQAYRLDFVATNLADWAPAYTIGLYMRRQEVLIPMHAQPPNNSVAERIRGRLVYQGEVWIDPAFRNRRLAVWMGRIGLLLSLIKWHPDAVWALAGQQAATNGLMLRMGFSHIERGFFRWQWVSEGIEPVEWIAVAERSGLEQLVSEILTTPPQFQLG